MISLDGLRVWLNIPPTPDTTRAESKSNGDVAADIDVAQNQASTPGAGQTNGSSFLTNTLS